MPKTKTDGDPRWIAKRDGATYCAPACGRGCAYIEYTRAQRGARALARALGPGWVPRVWENLGWHYEVHLPIEFRVEVHAQQYSAAPTSCGIFFGPDYLGCEDSPREALDAIWAAAVEQIDTAEKILDAIRPHAEPVAARRKEKG